MDSRKCSRIVSTLLERKLITKERESHKGKLTFRLRYAGKERHVDLTRFECLVAGSRFSPCTGCSLDCMPESCDLLLEWIGNLGEED
ncbi:MAG TPA: Lrp/AsnC family transcriptional regulator [Candidatus Methanoperedenaceae archaeon]|nr:Lrp/AsnC family transcriptional regulator [Candidatus Methanoperedenaceae archaeon]